MHVCISTSAMQCNIEIQKTDTDRHVVVEEERQGKAECNEVWGLRGDTGCWEP